MLRCPTYSVRTSTRSPSSSSNPSKKVDSTSIWAPGTVHRALEPSRLVIFCDAKHEGLWFRDLSPLLSDASFETIGGRGTNPPIIENLIYYDRPDIILLYDGEPVLVLEKTSEVPSGHNVGQRQGRMVRSIEQNIPAIYLQPFDAMKHGKHPHLCRLNPRLLQFYTKMWDIHDTPALVVNWPSDSDWELITDGSEDDEISAVVHDFLQSDFDWGCSKFLHYRQQMPKEAAKRIDAWKPYGHPPGSVSIIPTSSLAQIIHHRSAGEQSIPPEWVQRKESVVYKIGMSPKKCRREDPYTGTQFIYDYLYCRNGEKPEEKFRNLLFDLPKIAVDRWKEANPNDPGRKSVLWYATANGLLLSDGMIEVRD